MLNKTDSITRPFTCFVLLLLVIIATYLRIQGVSVFAYNADEAMILATAEADSLKKLVHYSFYEASHPPLYYIALHFWIKISQNIEFVRSLSLLFGIALIPLYYLIGKELNGRTTGLYTATLVTFSHGLIIQSYIVRQYSLFVFLLSGCVYCFLLWRKNYSQRILFAYLLLGGAACLTHFSSIFTIFILTICQAFFMYRQNSTGRNLVQWLMANAAIALIWCGIVYAWQQNTLAVAEIYSNPHFSLQERWGNIPKYMRIVLSYALPAMSTSFLFALCIPLAARKNSVWRDYAIRLLCIALGLGLSLILTNAYPYEEGRRALWLFPFIICAFGWTISDASETAGDFLTGHYAFPWHKLILICLLIIYVVGYNPRERFADSDEYEITKQNLQKYEDFLFTLGLDTRIIAEKDEALHLTNIFNYAGGDLFSSPGKVSAAPYHHTQIIFDSAHPRMRSTKDFLDTMEHAQEQGFFKNIDKLIFLRSSPVIELMQCPALEKEIHWFTEREFYTPQKNSERLFVNIPLMIVSKKRFFEQVMSPMGSARQCLTAK